MRRVSRARIKGSIALLAFGVLLAFAPTEAGAQYRPGIKNHDDQGRLISEADDQGRLWRYVYRGDGSREVWVGGRNVALEKPDQTVEAYAFDAQGRKTETRIAKPGLAPSYVRHDTGEHPAFRPKATQQAASPIPASHTQAAVPSYVRDDFGRLTSVTTSEGTTTYRYFEGSPVPLIQEVVYPDGSRRTYDRDVAQAAQTALAPFRPSATTAASAATFSDPCAASGNRFLFGSHLYDCELGLYHTPSGRLYDPAIGRFIQQDSYLGSIDNPPSLHRFTYAHNAPTRYIDPTGHFVAETVATGTGLLGAILTAPVIAAAAVGTAVASGFLYYEHQQNSELKEQERLAGEQSRASPKRWHDHETATAKVTAAGSLPRDGLIILEDEDANEELVDRQRREEARRSGTELGQAKSKARRDDAADEGGAGAPPRKPGFVPPTDRGTTGGDAESDAKVAANRGVVWVRETPTTRNPAVQDYQASAPGARSEIASRTPQVPALRFDNPNPRGHDIVRFDGMEGNTLIDRKWSVTSKTKQKADLQRMAVALSQNPGFQGRIEVPNQAEANQARRVLGQLGIANIDVKVVAPSP